MEPSHETEDELKRLLKSLLLENEPALGKDTEAKQKKFLNKLAALTQHEEEDSPSEVEKLRLQLDKVKPVIKKLVLDLNEARQTLSHFQENQGSPLEKVSLEASLLREKKEKETLLLQIQELKALLDEQVAERNVFLIQKQQVQELHARLKETEISLEQFKKLESEKEKIKQEMLRFQEQGQEEKREFEERLLQQVQLLQEKEVATGKIQEELQRQKERSESERQRLIERLAENLSQTQRQSEIIEHLREESNGLRQQTELNEERRRKLEREIEELKGRLSQSATDATRSSRALERDLLDKEKEIEDLRKKIKEGQEEQAEQKQALVLQVEEQVKQSQKLRALEEELAASKLALEASGHTSLKLEYENALAAQKNEWMTQVGHLQEALTQSQGENARLYALMSQAEEEYKRTFAKKEVDFEEILSQSYIKMKELSSRHGAFIEENHRLEELICEKENYNQKLNAEIQRLKGQLQILSAQNGEKDAEIRKAQQHLAKKVKENTLFHDLIERQKAQMREMQTVFAHHKEENERLQNQINLQRLQEEALQAKAKERAQSAERLAKEWQEKSVTQAQEIQLLKEQLNELQKIKKHYDHLQATFSSLRHFLVKTLDLPLDESEKKKCKIAPSLQDDFFDT